MNYKYVILRNPDTMVCNIYNIDSECPENYEVCGYAETMRMAYHVCDLTYEMER